MARVNNLSNFLTDVSNAIRNKTGKSATIPAANFDTEINSIETAPAVIDYTTYLNTPTFPQSSLGSKISDNYYKVLTVESGYIEWTVNKAIPAASLVIAVEYLDGTALNSSGAALNITISIDGSSEGTIKAPIEKLATILINSSVSSKIRVLLDDNLGGDDTFHVGIYSASLNTSIKR